MFYHDARTFGLPNGYTNGAYTNGAYTNGLGHGYPNTLPYGMTNAYRPDVYNPGFNGGIPAVGYAQAPVSGFAPALIGQELQSIHARIDELRFQMDVLCNLIRQQTLGQQAFGLNQTLGADLRNEFPQIPYASQILNRGTGNVRTRENDTHIILEVFLPHLSMGDVDVEISGNRIICRTRVPVNPAGRWWLNAQLPRGLELFELADGRVEFGWLVPVSFTAKEVEASWRDGFMCIYVPKADAATTRQTVAVVRDSKGRKTADMNS